MAVQVEPRDIANASPDTRARNPQLYAKPAREPKPAERQTVPRTANTRRSPGTARTVVRTVRQSAPAIGFGSVLVMLTGAGIGFAILSNPKLLTVPIQFITSLLSGFRSVVAAKPYTPPPTGYPIPQPST